MPAWLVAGGYLVGVALLTDGPPEVVRAEGRVAPEPGGEGVRPLPRPLQGRGPGGPPQLGTGGQRGLHQRAGLHGDHCIHTAAAGGSFSLSPGHLNWLLEAVCAGTCPAPASGHLLSADRVTATRRSGIREDDTQHWVDTESHRTIAKCLSDT